VGCSSGTKSYPEPVRLQYSVDYGSSWSAVAIDCSTVDKSLPPCPYTNALRSTSFYPDTYGHWTRVSVPLSTLHVCG